MQDTKLERLVEFLLEWEADYTESAIEALDSAKRYASYIGLDTIELVNLKKEHAAEYKGKASACKMVREFIISAWL